MFQEFFRDKLSLAIPRVQREDFEDGGFILRSPESLMPYARCIGEWLEHWASVTPHAIAIAERGQDDHWDRLSWSELRSKVGAIAQRLLDLHLPRSQPIAILSENSVDHALLMLAAMHVGFAVCTVSSAYSRVATDHSKISAILDALTPSLIYASDAKTYGRAIASWHGEARVVFSVGAQEIRGELTFQSMLESCERPAVMQAFLEIQPETPAKYLLTSGSTGHPKIVVNTHQMLCANQQMIAQVWRFLDHEKPVLLDWLPWSHTFGGNHNLNLVLRNGGSLFIDDGRPTPSLIGKTVRNLCEVCPTLLFNVPAGYDMLLPFLEADDVLSAKMFSKLKVIFYAAAALPPSTWSRLQRVAEKVAEQEVWFTTSWGSTETSPAVTSAYWEVKEAGCIGLPLPGMELKFVPNGVKLELRVRGVSVFPGYLNAPELTYAAFDEEGFYRIGDAGYLLDSDQPEAGVVFDGRVAEDFKLLTGTWVSVGTLKNRVLSTLAPYVQDVVVTAPDRPDLGVLLFPSAQGSVLCEEQLAKIVLDALLSLRATGAGSSQCPVRALVLRTPPDPAVGEITDKGYINQRAVLTNRADLVELLHSNRPDRRVIRL